MKYRVRKCLNYKGVPYYKAEVTGWWTPFWFCICYADRNGEGQDVAWQVCKDHALRRYNPRYRDPEGLYATTIIAAICLFVFILPILLGVPHV